MSAKRSKEKKNSKHILVRLARKIAGGNQMLIEKEINRVLGENPEFDEDEFRSTVKKFLVKNKAARNRFLEESEKL